MDPNAITYVVVFLLGALLGVGSCAICVWWIVFRPMTKQIEEEMLSHVAPPAPAQDDEGPLELTWEGRQS